MHYPRQDTMAFGTPVVEHWLEREIAQTEQTTTFVTTVNETLVGIRNKSMAPPRGIEPMIHHTSM